MNKKNFTVLILIGLIGIAVALYVFLSKNTTLKTSTITTGSLSDTRWRKVNDTANFVRLEVPENWDESFYEVADDIVVDPNRKGIRGWQFFSDDGKYEIGPEAMLDLSFYRLVEPKSLEDPAKADDEIMSLIDPATDIIEQPTPITVDGLSAVQYQVDNEGGFGEGGYYREIFIQRGNEIIELEMISYDRETYQRYEPLLDEMLKRIDIMERP